MSVEPFCHGAKNGSWPVSIIRACAEPVNMVYSLRTTRQIHFVH